MLYTQNLSIIRDNKTLIDDVNICIERGKVYALIGHNGSGKSTLIKALSAQTLPSSGQIYIDSQPLGKYTRKQIAQNIAYLPQKLPEAQGFCVQELVMLGRHPHQKWLQKANDHDKKMVDWAIDQTDSRTLLDKSVDMLSGGQKTRVWLAMCIAQQTPFLLLDEPLAPLDIVYQVQVLELIQKLAKEQNIGIVLIIHDINLAARYCDEFIALKRGKICHQASVNETMNQAALRHIFEVDFTLLTHPNGQSVAVL